MSSSVIERTHKCGTIFKFPGFRGYFVLARMVVPNSPKGNYFNLISLIDGNIKTASWQSYSGSAIEIPEYTWDCGGPPGVVYIPTGQYGKEENEDHRRVLDLIKHDDLLDKHRGKNLNRELIKSIKG